MQPRVSGCSLPKHPKLVSHPLTAKRRLCVLVASHPPLPPPHSGVSAPASPCRSLWRVSQATCTASVQSPAGPKVTHSTGPSAAAAHPLQRWQRWPNRPTAVRSDPPRSERTARRSSHRHVLVHMLMHARLPPRPPVWHPGTEKAMCRPRSRADGTEAHRTHNRPDRGIARIAPHRMPASVRSRQRP